MLMPFVNKLTSFILLAVLSMTLQSYTKRDILQHTADLQKVESTVVLNQKWVPYPAYADREGWNAFLGDYRQQLIEDGESCLDYRWRYIKATDYIEYERTGNRSIADNAFSANVTALNKLFLAELAEGKGRFIDDIIDGVYYFSEMTSWVSPAHIGPYQASKRSLPDTSWHVIDLASGDLSAVMSWIYYYLKAEMDKVTPTVSQRLYKEVKARTLDAYMGEHPFWWQAKNAGEGTLVNNWNVWCNANVLQCFFLLENDPERLAEAVYTTMVSVDQFLNYVKDDGACEEGPSYWGHAAGKLYDYLKMLSMGTAGKIDIFHQPIVRNLGEYIVRSYVGDGWVVNFADASAKGGGEAGFVYRFGKDTGSELMTGYAAYMEKLNPQRKINVNRDMFRLLQSFLYHKELETVAANFRHPAYTWYAGTEFCYMTNDCLFFAAKGGYNDESHNHNDTGTFNLYVDNTPVFIDAGVGTYTGKTFGRDRYTIWTMQSDYHNLPRINGFQQRYGKRYRSANVKFDKNKNTFSLDIGKAYPQEGNINSWVRTYALKKKGLHITDRFDISNPDVANVVHFMTWGEARIINKGVIDISIKGKTAELVYDAEVFTASIETVKLDDRRLSNVWGSEIHRICLTANGKTARGEYKFNIQIK